jgi:REP element-mobilizing transposase RayT
MVIAHHLLWTLYGWWLPNDPRGSTSRTVRCDVLADLGQLHFGRKRLQPASRDLRAFYQQAAARLQHPLLDFQPDQFPAVAAAFDSALRAAGYTCYALVVMPDHLHLVLRKHRDLAETMIDRLQAHTRATLIAEGLRPADHPVWTRGGWKTFLDAPDDVWRTMRYIENNPVPLRLPPQNWTFLTPYDNWPLHRKTRH